VPGVAAIVLASSRSIVDLDFTIVAQAVLFGVCFLLLRGLVFRPLLRLIDERRAQTDGVRADARRLEEDAEKRMKRILRSVQEAKIEAAAERERLRVLAKRREQEILRAAKEEAGRIAEAARRRVDAERSAAEREVDARARELGGAIAGRLAGRPV
jgi:F-type H+-transporting ATPase subunit b